MCIFIVYVYLIFFLGYQLFLSCGERCCIIRKILLLSLQVRSVLYPVTHNCAYFCGEAIVAIEEAVRQTN